MIQGLKILIVDDNEELLLAVQEALCDAGLQAAAVKTAEEACEQLGEGNYDILLADIFLGESNGALLGSVIRDSGSRMIMIAMSGYNLDTEECANAGFDYCVQKPFSTQVLIKTIEHACLN